MIRLIKLLRNIFFNSTPHYIVFFVTSFCNARCKMCFNWKALDDLEWKKQELKLEEIKKIFKSLGNIQQLSISGGETYLRDDLPEILTFISHNNDVQMITIPTNGILTERTYTHTKKILKGIKKSTHLRISLSIEGIGKKHDEIVQVPGAFEKILKTYARLNELKKDYRNFNIDVCTVTSVFNKNEMKDILKYLNQNFPQSSIELLLARGDTREKESRDVSQEEFQQIVNYMYELDKAKKINKPFAKVINATTKIINNQIAEILKVEKMPSRCYCGKKMIVIQSNGDLWPCEYLNKKMGNLRDYEYNIPKLLNTPENKKIAKDIKNGKCFCTWECALINNIACNPRTYPKVAAGVVKEFFK